MEKNPKKYILGWKKSWFGNSIGLHTYIYTHIHIWLIWYRICLKCRKHKFDPWVRRSPGEGSGYSLQYSCPGNSMDRRAWQATVPGVAKSQKRLGDWCTHATEQVW